MVNQPDNERRASTRQPVRGTAGMAWRCDDCRVWWGSQNSNKPTTAFLLHLPKAIALTLPWDEYRGWKLLAERASTCPECRQSTGRLVYAIA
jgi:hypothetical protein